MNNQTKHTPGPWTYRATPESLYTEYAVQMGRIHYGVYKLADARLIAAAPELLAELEQLEQAFSNSHSLDYRIKALASARAAIAKATGEA
jgi:hypothetical protein